MKKILLLLLSFSTGLFVHAQKNYWKQLPNNYAVGKIGLMERKTSPTTYKLYSVNLDALKTDLSKAPLRHSDSRQNLVLKFPNAEGQLIDYAIQEAPVMASELQQKFPDIRSYVGYQVGNNNNSIRFSITPYDGISIMYFNGWDVSYMDAYTSDLSSFIVYKRQDLPPNPEKFNCSFDEVNFNTEQNNPQPLIAPLVSDGKFRTYRLALACTMEYAAYHINRAGLSGGTLEQKKAAVMAAMTVAMTRVNGVYEKTIASTMVMVPNNDQLIFIESDSYSNNDGGAMLSQNQSVCNSIIGNANYDIGHVFSTGGGGIAYLKAVCSGNKAGGVTGLNAPINDAFYIDYVAHEIGHQFGANHTFRASTGSCSGNANNATAMEPGSGSTIMAYAGICGSNNNVQSNSDPYFHSASVNEMYAWISRANDCSAKTNLNNAVPTADAGEDYTIPYGTAFVLTGVATDADGDELTYLWEQTDTTSNTQPPVATATGGPVFRSFTPSTSPSRYFPVMSSILANNLTPKWEVIPNVARTLNFSLLINDNKATGNQSARDLMKVTVANTGPFKVTSHTSNTQYTGGQPTTVTWNVAGTDAAPISTANVQILLSTNGGNTFDVVLADSVPNNGSASVVLPNQDVTNARLMVKAVNNIYFAVNSSPFSIKQNLAVNEAAFNKGFALYPNPAKNEVAINLSKVSRDASYQIYDMSGRLISQGKLESENNKINISNIQSGNYRVVVNNNGETTSKSLVIK